MFINRYIKLFKNFFLLKIMQKGKNKVNCLFCKYFKLITIILILSIRIRCKIFNNLKIFKDQFFSLNNQSFDYSAKKVSKESSFRIRHQHERKVNAIIQIVYNQSKSIGFPLLKSYVSNSKAFPPFQRLKTDIQ